MLQHAPDEHPPKRHKTIHELVAEKYRMMPSKHEEQAPDAGHEHRQSVPEKVDTAPLAIASPPRQPEHCQSVLEKIDTAIPLQPRRPSVVSKSAKSRPDASPKQPSPEPKQASLELRRRRKQPPSSLTPETLHAAAELDTLKPATSLKSAHKTAQPSVRRGPALKQAGTMLTTPLVESESDPGTERLRERLREQKKRTKKHQARAETKEREHQARAEQQERELAAAHRARLALHEKIRALEDAAKSPAPRKLLSKREMFAGWDFSHADVVPPPRELAPAPAYAPREPGWRKRRYRAWEPARLMNVHVHRMREPAPSAPGFVAKIEDDGDGAAVRVSNCTPCAFEDFAGMPQDAMPLVKDGALGFKAGTIVSWPRADMLGGLLANGCDRIPGTTFRTAMRRFSRSAGLLTSSRICCNHSLGA